MFIMANNFFFRTINNFNRVKNLIIKMRIILLQKQSIRILCYTQKYFNIINFSKLQITFESFIFITFINFY